MLRLRPYKNCDAEHIVKWIKDEIGFRKWCADRFETYPLSAEMLNESYMKELDNDRFFEMTALEENKVVGHFIMRFVDDERKVLRFGFVIVDDSIRGKGYGKKMLSLGLKYAFEILKVDKVTIGVFDNNPGAYHCYKSLGFSEVGENEYYTIMNEQWLCIELEYKKSKWENHI